MEGVAVDPSQSVGTLITTIVDEPVMSLVASVNGGPSSNKFAGKGEAKRSTKRSKEGTGLTSGGEGSKDAKLAADGTFSVSKPYMQQTTNTQQDTQRKLEMQINRSAHTPHFKPGPYKAAKLSPDAAQLLADFIQRPAIRAQLLPLVGELPGKKRKARVLTGDDGMPLQKAVRVKKAIVISEETGRRLKTRLSSQQTKVLEEKYAEKPQWKPSECATLLPALNTLGPQLVTEQVSRWFDNKRRSVKRSKAREESGESAEKRTWKKRKVEKRVRHSEREMLEAAYAQNCAPDIHVRTALATAINISEKQVTAWFTRRQQTGRAPYGVTPGAVSTGSGGGHGGQQVSLTAGQTNSMAQVSNQQQHLLPAHLGAAPHLLLPQSVTQGDFPQGMQPSILGGMAPPGTINPIVNRPQGPAGATMWGW